MDLIESIDMEISRRADVRLLDVLDAYSNRLQHVARLSCPRSLAHNLYVRNKLKLHHMKNRDGYFTRDSLSFRIGEQEVEVERNRCGFYQSDCSCGQCPDLGARGLKYTRGNGAVHQRSGQQGSYCPF